MMWLNHPLQLVKDINAPVNIPVKNAPPLTPGRSWANGQIAAGKGWLARKAQRDDIDKFPEFHSPPRQRRLLFLPGNPVKVEVASATADDNSGK
jgi:hypothetical protein